VAADFFVSYTSVDEAWAEWIAGQLEDAGYSVVLQAWDFGPGGDFVHQMQQATSMAGRTVAVLSPDYFRSRFGEAEWRAAFAKDPTGELGLLVPIRVRDFAPSGLLASRVYIDLVGVDEHTAAVRLRSGVGRAERGRRGGSRFQVVLAAQRHGDTQVGYRRSSACRPAIRTSPAEAICSRRYEIRYALGRPARGLARSTGLVVSARPSLPSSTPTGTPPTTT
jgi:hypothetical protein